MTEERNLTTTIESAVTNMDSTLSKIPSIFSRVETILDKPLKVIDEEKLELIKTRLKEQNEKMYIFGRRDSQTTRKLMTLQMLNTADSSYRVLKQILAQIEKKQMALSQSYLKLKKDYNNLKKFELALETTTDELSGQKLKISIEEKQVNISNSFIYLEGALKEVGLLQDSYEQIKKNKGIGDDWDEMDYEKSEIETHIRNAFRNGVRDFLCSGRLNMGTAEYLEQFGISPVEGIYHIRRYVDECNLIMKKVDHKDDYGRIPDYDHFYDFLNEMVDLFKDSYLKACKRLGIDGIISTDFMLMSMRNKNKLLEEKGEV